MLEAFDQQIAVPAVADIRELGVALTEFQAFDPAGINQSISKLREYSDNDHVGVGIKTVLTMAESAQMVAEPVNWFVEQLGQAVTARSVGRLME
jgi:vesicle-fusing ATPase